MIASFRWTSNVGEHFVRLDQIAGIEGGPRQILVYFISGEKIDAGYVLGQEEVCADDMAALMDAWDTYLSRSLE